MNDIGGQPGFLEMLPALSTGPAIYLVFLDLTKDLDKPYEIAFSRDEKKITPYQAIHTVRSTISQILAAISSVHYIFPQSTLPPEAASFLGDKFKRFRQIEPMAALVGTHKDKLVSSEEKIQQIDKGLKEIKQDFKKITNISGSSFFPVDNYYGTRQSDITPIRKFINESIRSHFKEASLPIRPKWLIFSTILRIHYKIVEFKDCLEIAKILEMGEKEVKSCLWYLHCIGTLMHFTDIVDDEDSWFKNHIICTPQVIFDSISKLIVTFLFTIHSAQSHVKEAHRDELIEKGQFSIDTIEKYCCKLLEDSDKPSKAKNLEEELIDAEHLVKLLSHLNLLSSITHVEDDGSERVTYFMPAVLDCAKEDQLPSCHPVDTNNPEPLFIKFRECGYVPTGTFCGLISRLVSPGSKGILGLTWRLVEEGVKRNCVSFYIDNLNKVTLLCRDKFYELWVSRENTDISLHDLCTYVLSVILYTLKSLYDYLTPEIAFKCPCSKHQNHKDINPSLCTLVESKISIAFFQCGTQKVELHPAQRDW